MENWYRTSKQTKPNNEMEERLLQYFSKHPSPSDADVQAWAKDNGTEPSQVRELAYALLSSVLFDGRAKKEGVTENDVDAKELSMGIEIEREHTTNSNICRRIAIDHLAELPDYYSRLKKMEEGEHD